MFYDIHLLHFLSSIKSYKKVKLVYFTQTPCLAEIMINQDWGAGAGCFWLLGAGAA